MGILSGRTVCGCKGLTLVSLGPVLKPEAMPAHRDQVLVRRIHLGQAFAQAAQVAFEAGFDAVEPHGAHGFVLTERDEDAMDAVGGSGRLAVALGL